VVHARDAANVARLQPVLESIDAVFRIQPERRLKPNASHLGLSRPSESDYPVWTLGPPRDNRPRSWIPGTLPHSCDLNISEGLRIRVLDLETLIALKEELGGEKDRAALPILRRTLDEKRKR
jgi:hypothetical protein